MLRSLNPLIELFPKAAHANVAGAFRQLLEAGAGSKGSLGFGELLEQISTGVTTIIAENELLKEKNLELLFNNSLLTENSSKNADLKKKVENLKDRLEKKEGEFTKRINAELKKQHAKYKESLKNEKARVKDFYVLHYEKKFAEAAIQANSNKKILNEKLEEVEKKNNELQEKNGQLKTKNDNLKATLINVQEVLKSHSEELQSILKQKVTTLKNRLKEVQKENTTLSAKNNDLKDKNSTLQARYEESLEKVTKLKNTLKKVQNENRAKFERDLNTKHQDAIALKKQNAELQKQNGQLENKNDNLKATLKNVQTQLQIIVPTTITMAEKLRGIQEEKNKLFLQKQKIYNFSWNLFESLKKITDHMQNIYKIKCKEPKCSNDKRRLCIFINYKNCSLRPVKGYKIEGKKIKGKNIYYLGRITNVHNNGTYDVEYDDGTIQNGVNNIRPRDYQYKFNDMVKGQQLRKDVVIKGNQLLKDVEWLCNEILQKFNAKNDEFRNTLQISKEQWTAKLQNNAAIVTELQNKNRQLTAQLKNKKSTERTESNSKITELKKVIHENFDLIKRMYGEVSIQCDENIKQLVRCKSFFDRSEAQIKNFINVAENKIKENKFDVLTKIIQYINKNIVEKFNKPKKDNAKSKEGIQEENAKLKNGISRMFDIIDKDYGQEDIDCDSSWKYLVFQDYDCNATKIKFITASIKNWLTVSPTSNIDGLIPAISSIAEAIENAREKNKEARTKIEEARRKNEQIIQRGNQQLQQMKNEIRKRDNFFRTMLYPKLNYDQTIGERIIKKYSKLKIPEFTDEFVDNSMYQNNKPESLKIGILIYYQIILRYLIYLVNKFAINDIIIKVQGFYQHNNNKDSGSKKMREIVFTPSSLKRLYEQVLSVLEVSKINDVGRETWQFKLDERAWFQAKYYFPK